MKNSPQVSQLLADYDAARKFAVRLTMVLEAIGLTKLPPAAQNFMNERDWSLDATLEVQWKDAIGRLATDASVPLPE